MKSRSILIETIIITTITVAGMVFIPSGKILFALLPIIYLLFERRKRQRSWCDLGFKTNSFWADLRANWLIFILVGFIVQPVIIIWSKTNFPTFLTHVQARLPFENGINWLTLLPLLALSLIGEEMTFRTLIQGRLALFIGNPAALVVASTFFGLAHIAPGSGPVILLDVGLIFNDSILYGTMFARRNNLWVVWLAHLLGDVMGLLVMTTI